MRLLAALIHSRIFFLAAYLCHFSAYFHTHRRLSLFDERVRYFFPCDIGAVIVCMCINCIIPDTITSIDFQFKRWLHRDDRAFIDVVVVAFAVVINISVAYKGNGKKPWREYGGKPAASQSRCVLVFVGHLRMYYKCGVRLFKHPAHDYLINCLTEFIFIKFFSSFVFFHRFYPLFVTFTLLFLRSNIWRRKKNYLYKHLAQSLIHPKIEFFIRSIMWESDFRWSRMPFCVYIIQFGCLRIQRYLYLYDIHFSSVIENWMQKKNRMDY